MERNALERKVRGDLLPDSSTARDGRLSIGGCVVDDLASQFGTPLYVYDELTLRHASRQVKLAFAGLGARISFAVKACATPGVLDIFRDEGLDLDVVSGGEMAVAMRCGFLPAQVHLHGNAKADDELEMATRLGIRAVVVDNREELERLSRICEVRETRINTMLRLALPIEATTHPHLQTGGRHTKFGIALNSGAEEAALDILARCPALTLTGVHAHVGSQVADASVFAEVADTLVTRARALQERGFPIAEVGLGGGWAVPYCSGDTGLEASQVARAVQASFPVESGLRPAVEPGRYLVARAAVSVYRVLAVKTGSRHRVIAVDGGMGDNLRPALYGARYQVFATQDRNGPSTPADVVGRYCEAGDVLARGVHLPPVKAGDLLAMPVAGAYQLTMSSAYNLVPQPAVVMVTNGNARLLTRRARIEDLVMREVFPLR